MGIGIGAIPKLTQSSMRLCGQSLSSMMVVETQGSVVRGIRRPMDEAELIRAVPRNGW